MSFGFAVGDFIAALELVGTVVGSLRESGGAKAHFRELMLELYGLETALLRVKQLEFEDDEDGQYAALRLAACQCQQTVDKFWTKTSGYQKYLLSDARSSRAIGGWKKVQWTLFKSDEIANFKAEIAAHTQSIILLLTAVQMTRVDVQHKANQAQLAGLKSLIQSAVQQCFEVLVQVSSAVSSSALQSQQILQSTVRIFRQNVQIYSLVCSVHDMVTRLPPQVDRQQPVYMIDALGKFSPFHLEFVRSASALQAVLQANF